MSKYSLLKDQLLAEGLLASGDIPQPVAPIQPFLPEGTQPLTILLVLRAFASGSSGLTGTEAVANGVQAFKPDESRNASVVLLVMATLFIGISYLATTIGIIPDASETETILSLLAKSLVGTSWFFYVVQATTAVILQNPGDTAFVRSWSAGEGMLPGAALSGYVLIALGITARATETLRSVPSWASRRVRWRPSGERP